MKLNGPRNIQKVLNMYWPSTQNGHPQTYFTLIFRTSTFAEKKKKNREGVTTNIQPLKLKAQKCHEIYIFSTWLNSRQKYNVVLLHCNMAHRLCLHIGRA